MNQSANNNEQSAAAENRPVPPDNENVKEGKKAMEAADVANPVAVPEEKEETDRQDEDTWRNEG